MLSARESVTGLLQLGLVETGFQSPDPDQHESAQPELVRLNVYNLPQSPIRTFAYRATKRFIDIAISGSLLVVMLPVLFVLGLLVKLTSRGPIIFSQERLTQGGRVFRMLKLRSMRVDAEEGRGPMWAEEDDPRVTRFGKFLRLTHLDELPQLINVLRGDMSLIGPRPERPEIAAELETVLPNFRKRLAVKGGITGLAQVSSGYAANLQTYREKLSLDLFYVNNRSLMMDLSIAAKTVLVLIIGDEGAR